jgi:hypothetical protein
VHETFSGTVLGEGVLAVKNSPHGGCGVFPSYALLDPPPPPPGCYWNALPRPSRHELELTAVQRLLEGPNIRSHKLTAPGRMACGPSPSGPGQAVTYRTPSATANGTSDVTLSLSLRRTHFHIRHVFFLEFRPVDSPGHKRIEWSSLDLIGVDSAPDLRHLTVSHFSRLLCRSRTGHAHSHVITCGGRIRQQRRQGF